MALVSLSSRASIHREDAQHLSCFRDIPNSAALPLGFRANVRAKYGNTHVTLRNCTATIMLKLKKLFKLALLKINISHLIQKVLFE